MILFAHDVATHASCVYRSRRPGDGTVLSTRRMQPWLPAPGCRLAVSGCGTGTNKHRPARATSYQHRNAPTHRNAAARTNSTAARPYRNAGAAGG